MAEVIKFVIEDMDVLAKKVAQIIMEEMKPEPLADNTTFTPEEAAEYLRCSRETIYRMVRRK